MAAPAAISKSPLSLLALKPRIETMDDGCSFYIDQYTGEAITHRCGLPGKLVKGKACKKENASRMYGSFRDWNTVVTWVVENKSQIGPEYASALIDWVNTIAKQTVKPAPKRSTLKLHGGHHSFDQYHEQYQSNSKECIEARLELSSRLAEQQGGEAEEQKEKSVSNSQKMIRELKNAGNASEDVLLFYTLGVCPKYDVWCLWPSSVVHPPPPLTLPTAWGNMHYSSCATKLTKKMQEDLKNAEAAAKEQGSYEQQPTSPTYAPNSPSRQDISSLAGSPLNANSEEDPVIPDVPLSDDLLSFLPTVTEAPEEAAPKKKKKRERKQEDGAKKKSKKQDA